MTDTVSVSAPLRGNTLQTGTMRFGLRTLAVLVCIYSVGAAIRQPATYAATVRDYLWLAMPPVLFAVAVAMGFAILRRRQGGLAAQFHAFGRRARFVLAAVLLLVVGLSGFTTYKLLIPTVMPFIWDMPFDAIDRALHGGAPWQFTHALVPPIVEDIMGTFYGMPWFLYWFGTFGFVVFCVGEPLRSRYLWAISLSFILLGTVAATALASHGPIFFPEFGRTGYEGLIAALDGNEVGRSMRASAGYLFGAYSGQTPLLGGGISAMPSMHVAIVTLNLCLYTGVNRWLAIPTGAYAVLVLIGSVHFGWHYAIDGYVSIAAVLALWWLAGRLARPSPAAAAANA